MTNTFTLERIAELRSRAEIAERDANARGASAIHEMQTPTMLALLAHAEALLRLRRWLTEDRERYVSLTSAGVTLWPTHPLDSAPCAQYASDDTTFAILSALAQAEEHA